MATQAPENYFTDDMDPLRRAEEGQAAGRPQEKQSCGFSWLTALGFAFLTFNSGMALYRSNGDLGGVAFVVFSYIDLLLLFYYLRPYDRWGGANSSSASFRVVRSMVWVLSVLLTALLGWKVASALPLPVAVVVWALGAAGLVGLFYAFFLNHGGHP